MVSNAEAAELRVADGQQICDKHTSQSYKLEWLAFSACMLAHFLVGLRKECQLLDWAERAVVAEGVLQDPQNLIGFHLEEEVKQWTQRIQVWGFIIWHANNQT